MVIVTGGQSWEMRFNASKYPERQAERIMLERITGNGPDPQVWSTLVFPDGV